MGEDFAWAETGFLFYQNPSKIDDLASRALGMVPEERSEEHVSGRTEGKSKKGGLRGGLGWFGGEASVERSGQDSTESTRSHRGRYGPENKLDAIEAYFRQRDSLSMVRLDGNALPQAVKRYGYVVGRFRLCQPEGPPLSREEVRDWMANRKAGSLMVLEAAVADGVARVPVLNEHVSPTQGLMYTGFAGGAAGLPLAAAGLLALSDDRKVLMVDPVAIRFDSSRPA